MKRISTILALPFLFAFFAAALLVPRDALADDTGVWKPLKGRIIVSDQELPQSGSSDAAMVAELKRAHKAVIPGGGSWTLNLMVFLKAPAGAPKINVVYYDVTNPKKPEQVNFTEIDVQPTQKTVAIAAVPLSKEMGIVAGHKYEIRATRLLAGNKEDVYAKATVTLK